MYTAIQEKLFALSDGTYKDFICKLTPTIKRENVIGVRIPALRSLAKELSGSEEANEFVKTLPHVYYEENNLHAFLIEKIKDYDKAVAALDAFLPYVDNWATCDSMRPAVLGKHIDRLVPQCVCWMSSKHTYTVRFGIEMLMNFCLDKHFDKTHLQYVASVKSDEYYVNMMCAWYFATALAKQYGDTIPYIEQNRLSPWVKAKTISKANESFRIDDDKKKYLVSLK